jgi:hypothetical protein
MAIFLGGTITFAETTAQSQNRIAISVAAGGAFLQAAAGTSARLGLKAVPEFELFGKGYVYWSTP